ncbi:hypothetical protein AruPA_15230 [Acidiphilium sp. PA]|uniref:hypothetical protein n=1 Tax=Acidiphilium sp. PA TaxID=2871705 RepID=UPI002244A29C|nr:hypothetical protein [Acidiphilium sp. PA]MCW8308390.1 hypothetical protein [Acidiphilium sp. PA]
MALYRVRGGFTLAMGSAGTFTGGAILDLTPELAKAWSAQIEPADETPGHRPARPRPKPPEKVVMKTALRAS